MLTDADFHKQILAEPDSGTPRLIYADWLEEEGVPLCHAVRKSLGKNWHDVWAWWGGKSPAVPGRHTFFYSIENLDMHRWLTIDLCLAVKPFAEDEWHFVGMDSLLDEFRRIDFNSESDRSRLGEMDNQACRQNGWNAMWANRVYIWAFDFTYWFETGALQQHWPGVQRAYSWARVGGEQAIDTLAWSYILFGENLTHLLPDPPVMKPEPANV